MAREAKQRQAATTVKQAQPDTEALQAELRSFASGLGLAAGGPGSGFDDSDFRPPVAGQRSKADIKPKQKTQGENNGRPASRPVQGTKHRSNTSVQQPASGEQQTETPDIVRERNWNAGVGARPGEKQGKSLLARDAPSIWYEAASELPALPSAASQSAAATAVSEAEFEAKKQTAIAALQNEEAVFEKDLGRKNGQDAKWLQQVRRSGTTSDKVAALTLLLQENAVANLRSLDALLTWVLKRKGGRNVVAQAIDALKEIFLVALLPDRKLRFFEQQPLASVPANKEGSRRLLFYYVEDCLKKRYSSFVGGLEECSRDNLEFLKDKALKAMFDLLRSKPEQESKLLSGMVNKLGDPSRKIASRAGYLLGSLLEEHPAMKVVLVAEVQRFMFRQGLQERARYYGVIFLNQMVLSHRPDQGGSDLARRLIEIYFTLFKLILEGQVGRAAATAKEEEAKKAIKGKDRHRDRAGGRGRGRGRGRGHGRGGRGGRGSSKHPDKTRPEKPQAMAQEVDARILSAIIAGVRRAFPFVATDDVQPLIEKHSDALFKMIHTAPFAVAVQALLLLFQLMAAQNAVSDRFYRALYAVLLHPEAAKSGKSPMFLSLVYKAMKGDVSNKRIAAFAKRLLQVAEEQQPAFTCGCLLMLSELLKGKPALWNSVLEAEDHADDVEHFQDYLDPLDTEGTAEDNDDQQPAQHSMRNTSAQRAQQGASSSKEKEVQKADSSSEEEAAEPSQQQDDTSDSEEEETLRAGNQDLEPSPNGIRNQLPGPEGESHAGDVGPGVKLMGGYDMRKRQPEFSGGDRSCWWELTCLGGHVHPSVAAFARTLLAGTYISYDGDPLRDLTLTAFLDKFVQRKPKAHAKGSSLMQPLLTSERPSTAQVGSDAFAALAEAEVAPDAQFFHKYYSLASVKGKTQKKRKRDDDSDEAEAFSDSGSDLDDALEAEEEFEDTIGGSHDYADLASAMRQADADSDQEEEDQGASDLGSENEEMLSDVDQLDSEHELVHLGSDDSAGEQASSDEEEQSQSSGSLDDDLNPFELAEGTDSDDDKASRGKQNKKKRNVAPWDDIPDDDSNGEGSSDEDNWVMHKAAEKQEAASKADTAAAAKQAKRQLKAKRPPTGGMNAFASADDYMQDIETDLAAVPADVAVTESADEQKASKPRRKQQVQRQKGRK